MPFPPSPCPPGTYPRLVRINSERRVVCAPEFQFPGWVTPFGGPASGLFPLGGRVGPEPVAVAPCLSFVPQNLPGPPFFFNVFVSCGPVPPGSCVAGHFRADAFNTATTSAVGYRLTPPNPVSNAFPRSRFGAGQEIVLHQEDVILGARYVAEQNNLLRTFTLTKNGVPVGSLVSSGTFVNGPNLMGTPVNQRFPSVMFPGQFAVLHGSQIAEFNSAGVLVANRLLQFLEQPIPAANFTESIGSVTLCNRTLVAIPVGVQIAQLEVRGINFRTTT